MGCGGAPANPAKTRPNVILISIDTLRADHLGCYGYAKATTPNIDRFASRSVVFERCQSAVPITLPSHTTIMSGMYPIRHSVRDNGTFTVPHELPTLATILKDEGYTTLAAIGSFPLTSRFGLDRGFDVYDEDLNEGGGRILNLFFDERKADKVTERALELMDGRETDPFFLFAHYFDPHHPWDPPSFYLRQHPERPYDAEISFVDTWVGQLLNEIEQRGLLDNSIVILTSDHGEGLDHSREYTHSFLLYQGTLHVPLMIFVPEQPGGRVDRFVSLADITPTVLDLLDIHIDHEIDGLSLFGPVSDDRFIYMESLAGRLERGWNDLRAVISGTDKLILGNPAELYDLAADPSELQDLSTIESEKTSQLEASLLGFIDSAPQRRSLAASYSTADAEVESRLRALGYLTGDATELSLDELGDITPERDPRPLVQLVWVQSMARSLINDGAYHEAITLLEDTLARVGEDADYTQHLALAYTLAGDFDEAMPLIDELLEDRADADVSPFVLASIARANLGDTDGALDAIDDALAVAPDATLRVRKADLLARSGRGDEATAILEQALIGEPCQPSVLNELAKMHRRAADRQSARTYYLKILECEPDNPQAMYNLGSMCLEEGDTEQARRFFDDATAADTRYAPGHFGLALVDLEEGRREAAIASLKTILGGATRDHAVSGQAAKLLSTLENNDGETD